MGREGLEKKGTQGLWITHVGRVQNKKKKVGNLGKKGICHK